MVVSAHRLASEAGVEVLRRGGNAVDAAIAVAYALAVTYPAAGNLGGGGFMTVQLADGRRDFIDFREQAPQAASADMYLDASGEPLPGRSTEGWLAVAVPGTVAGLELARERFGSRPRSELLAPAIRLAREGFALDQGDVDMLATATAAFRRDPASAAIFLHDGQPWQAGERLLQSDLARTLERIASEGGAGFYHGPVAAALVAASQAGHGILAQTDLDHYQARERKPVECDYRGYHVVSAPPPSSGGTILCEMLNVLQGYPLAALGWHSAQGVHFQIEAMRHAYVDRNNFLGDPDFVANPVARLLSPEYAARVRNAIDPAHAADSHALRAGEAPHEGSNTTHFSVIDRDGNAVALTYTLNNWFGAHVTATGTGVLMNDEMDDFAVKPGAPNLYGLVQSATNAIAPGKRPLSSMTPTIVSRDGQPVLVLGTPGGSMITTSVLQVMLNVIDYGMTVQEAVDAPRFHQQWLPPTTRLEPFALSADSRRLLEAMGQQFSNGAPANHVAAILVGGPALDRPGPPGMRYFGANDPRHGTGAALGY
ncbi:MAG: gamma-glutamyltransferase [Pseudomonadota bacterium]|nr:gamma-glutamyltransferase [Pseudomonadota bacterium]